jgi:hypothetical protein
VGHGQHGALGQEKNRRVYTLVCYIRTTQESWAEHRNRYAIFGAGIVRPEQEASADTGPAGLTRIRHTAGSAGLGQPASPGRTPRPARCRARPWGCQAAGRDAEAGASKDRHKGKRRAGPAPFGPGPQIGIPMELRALADCP